MGIIIHDSVTLNCGIAKSDIYVTVHATYQLTKNIELDYKVVYKRYYYASHETPIAIQVEESELTISNLQLSDVVSHIYNSIKQDYQDYTDI